MASGSYTTSLTLTPTSSRPCRLARPIPASSRGKASVATRILRTSSLVLCLAVVAALNVSIAERASAAPQLCPPTFDWCIGDGEPGDDPRPGPGSGPEEEPQGCGETWRTVDPPDGDVPEYIG